MCNFSLTHPIFLRHNQIFISSILFFDGKSKFIFYLIPFQAKSIANKFFCLKEVFFVNSVKNQRNHLESTFFFFKLIKNLIKFDLQLNSKLISFHISINYPTEGIIDSINKNKIFTSPVT
jgi:hypothetical protein